jgi:ATP-dependent DNA helicase PIF1
MVSFHQNQNIGNALHRPSAEKSMLTKYFETDRKDADARDILYRDFPEHYTWNSKDKFCKKRVRECIFQVGRIVQAHPGEGERYYLRVLLNHVAGATSFTDLRIVDNVEYATFREAVEKRGLIEGDNAWEDALSEATIYAMPQSLRRLFATILVFGEPSNVAGLWEKDKDAMGEDYARDNPCQKSVEQLVLINIRDMLRSMGKSIKKFPLPKIDRARDR